MKPLHVSDKTSYGAASGRIVFTATQPDVNGCFDVQMSMQDVSFVGYRFALRYDAAALALEIASSDETKPYQKALPAGAALLNLSGDVPVTVTFDLTALAQNDKTEVEMPKIEDNEPSKKPATEKPAADKPEGEPEMRTVDELLADAIVLQIGTDCAVVAGAPVRLDPADKTVQPYLKDGRTFVPVRFLSERMGAAVDWDAGTRTVTIRRGEKTIALTIGQTAYTADGVAKTLDAPAEIMGGRTMVPIRFVSEALGRWVGWDAKNRLVVIAPADAPWELSGTTEQKAVARGLELLAARDFIG